MTLLIDNYDSFSYNLYQIVGTLDPDILVIRNDEKTVDEIETLHPDRIILSPGPGRPEDGRRHDSADSKAWRQNPHSRNLPGPSGHLCRLWRFHYLCQGTDAWKAIGGSL